MFLVNSRPARILFDSGATYSFVSYNYSCFLDCVLVMLENSFSVDTTGGVPLVANKVFRDCILILDYYDFTIDLIPTTFMGLTLWLEWIGWQRIKLISSIQRR